MCKDYRGEPCWTKCEIKKKIGPYTYIVNVSGTNLTWKRHINQIRECELKHCDKDAVTNKNRVTSANDISLELSLADELLNRNKNPVNRDSHLEGTVENCNANENINLRPTRIRKPPERLIYTQF